MTPSMPTNLKDQHVHRVARKKQKNDTQKGATMIRRQRRYD